jgi:hypothetical protein
MDGQGDKGHRAEQVMMGSNPAIGIYLKRSCCHVLEAHAYNPSYSGDRNQEDHSSKPAWANSL